MTRLARMRTLASCLAASLLSPVACHSGADHQTPALPELRIEPPPRSATKAEQLPGLHNVVTYADDLVCGGVPEGDEGFATLAAMGIKTILSVDGARPDVAAAERHGLRYVHLPISYDTVTPERERQLAQAIANLPQPIYVHCHHGQHRSAAALGTAAVLAGRMTNEQVLERMGVSGTSKSYEGLWQAVRTARAIPAAELRADPASFPSVTEVTGMVGTMAEIDKVIDLVKQAHEAGWQAPTEHPDLVASKETGRLAQLFANLRGQPESQALPGDYQTRLGAAIEHSAALDAAVRTGHAEAAAAALARLKQSCKECHAIYRDR